MNTEQSLAEADRLISNLNAIRPFEPAREASAFQKIRLEWNYHSNAMEGNSLSFGQTKAFLMHELTASGKPFKDYLDIRGHNEVIDQLIEFVANKDELTESVIRGLHKLLLVEPYDEKSVRPDGVKVTRRVEVGEFKKTPNHVVTVGGHTHHFASPEETPAKVAELIKWYRKEREQKTLHPIAFAALVHHQFLAIHPFDDGNGRMARVLMNLVLMEQGYFPVVIKLESKNEYLLALERANVGEFDDLIRLVANAEVETTTIYIKAANGEPIDDLVDFDKRLHLLAQVVETDGKGSAGELTQEAQNYVVCNFASPLFRAVIPRLTHVDRLFAERQLLINYYSGGKPGIIAGPMAQMLEELVSHTSAKLLSSLQLFYHATGYRHGAEKSFLLSAKAYFHPSHFAVGLQMTGLQEVEVYAARYTDFPGDGEADSVARIILQHLSTSLEKLVNSKPK